MKLSIMVEELCEGLPAFFCNFVSHVHSLNFDRKPDYQYLYSILSQVSKFETEIDQPSNVLPPACSHTLPSTRSPASPLVHPPFNAHCAPVFSNKK